MPLFVCRFAIPDFLRFFASRIFLLLSPVFSLFFCALSCAAAVTSLYPAFSGGARFLSGFPSLALASFSFFPLGHFRDSLSLFPAPSHSSRALSSAEKNLLPVGQEVFSEIKDGTGTVQTTSGHVGGQKPRAICMAGRNGVNGALHISAAEPPYKKDDNR